MRRNERKRTVPLDVLQRMHDEFVTHCNPDLLRAEGWKVKSYQVDRDGNLK